MSPHVDPLHSRCSSANRAIQVSSSPHASVSITDGRGRKITIYSRFPRFIGLLIGLQLIGLQLAHGIRVCGLEARRSLAPCVSVGVCGPFVGGASPRSRRASADHPRRGPRDRIHPSIRSLACGHQRAPDRVVRDGDAARVFGWLRSRVGPEARVARAASRLVKIPIAPVSYADGVVRGVASPRCRGSTGRAPRPPSRRRRRALAREARRWARR
jgi:hypothetical protein